MKKEKINEITMCFPAISKNEGAIRQAVCAFFAQLDPTIEELADLRTALSASLPDSTVITVAQRVSSVKNCDLILVINGGKIIGCGKHEDLMENCEEYKEISASQMGGAFLD